MSSSDLEQQETPESESNGVSRRDVIKRGLVIGGATYVVPAVVSMVSPLGAFAATPTPTAGAGVNLVPCTVVLQQPAAAPVLTGVTGTVIGVIQPLSQTQTQSQSQSATATATASSTIAVRVTITGVDADVVALEHEDDAFIVLVFDREGNEIPGLARLLRRGADGSITIDVQGTANASASATTVQVQTQRQMQVGGVLVPAGVILFQTVVVPCVISPLVVLPIGTVTRTVTQTVTRTGTVTQTATAALPTCNFAVVPSAIFGSGVTGTATVLQSQNQTQSGTATATATASSAFRLRITIAGLRNLNTDVISGGGGGGTTTTTTTGGGGGGGMTTTTTTGGGSVFDTLSEAQLLVLVLLNPAQRTRLGELNQTQLSGLVALSANLQGPLNARSSAELAILATLTTQQVDAFLALVGDTGGGGMTTGTATTTATGTATTTATGTATTTATTTTANNIGTIFFIDVDVAANANASAAATVVQVQSQQQQQVVTNTGQVVTIQPNTVLFTTIVTNSPCIIR